MRVSEILSSLGITRGCVKAKFSVAKNDVISYKGQYYEGSAVAVSSYTSPEIVQKALVSLDKKYSNLPYTLESPKKQWNPVGMVPSGSTWIPPEGEG